MSTRRQVESASRRSLRWMWLALGWVAVGLGAVGVVVPGLPTTGFFVLAASCFARSSPRFERWVLSLPKIGPLVRDHRAGLGMPRRAKAVALTFMLAAVAASIAFSLRSLLAQALVVAAGAIGVWYVGWRIPTRERVLAADGGSPTERADAVGDEEALGSGGESSGRATRRR